jgi:PAS domain S-box-containing protein
MESLQSLSVLLIEDNPSDVLLLETALEADPIHRFELTHVERLSDGLKKLDDAAFDIVLADLGLPDSSGLNTFEQLHEQVPDLPIVVFSGNDDEAQAAKAVRAGAQDYLVKSLNGFDMAARMIRYALERHHQQQALRESEKRFAKAFHSSPAAQAITRLADEKIVDVNDAYCRLTRYTREQLIGHTTEELHFWVNPVNWQNMVYAWESQGRSQDIEVEFHTPTGEVLTLLGSAELIELNGEPCIIATALDITKRKQAEEALKAEQMRFAQVAATVPGAITMLRTQPDGQFSLLYVSKMFDDIFGLPSDDLSKNVDAILQRIPPDDIQNILGRLAEFAAGMQPSYMEFHYRHPLKGDIWLENRAQPVQDADGSVLWYGVTSDITERKQADDKLRESEERHRLISELISDYVYNGTVFANGASETNWVSGAFEQITGYSIKEVNQFPNGFFDLVQLDDLEALMRGQAQFFQERSRTAEYRIRRKNGDICWLRDYMQITEIDPQTNTIHLMGAVQDITERKQAEEKLRASEERYRNLIENMNEVVMEVDERGDFCFISPNYTKLAGYSSEWELNTSALDHVHPDDIPLLLQTLQNDLLKFDQSIVYRVQTQNGDWHWIEASGHSYQTETGENHIISVARDVTERKQAEEALRASDERLRKVLQTTSDGFWIVNSSGSFLDINEAYCTMTGYSREELLRMSISDVEAMQTVQDIGEHIRYIFSDGSDRFESRHRRKDGSAFDVEISVNVINRETGFMVCFIRDITERKQAEKEALYRQELLEKVIKLGKKIAAITDLDQCLREIYNGARFGLGFDRIGFFLYDHTIDHLLGVYGTSRTGEVEEAGFYEGPLYQNGSWSKALQSPTGISWLADYQKHFNPPEGHTMYGVHQHVTVAAWAGEKPVAVITADNLLTDREIKPAEVEALQLFAGYVGLAIENATLHAELERKVEERTAEVQDLYDNAPAGYHSLDANGCFIRINRTELGWLGYTREEVIGHPIPEFITENSLAIFREKFPLFKQRGYLRDLELEMVRKDGSIFPILISATAITDKSGNFILSRTTVFDNTLRRQAEESLQHANVELERALRMKDEFLASMSHELRTPLTGILGLSEALQYDTYGELNQKQKQIIANIENSGRHLLDLINDILDISKMESGKFELDMEPCPLGQICQSSLQLVKGMAHKKEQYVAFTMHPVDVVVKGDARRLKQILVNLLSNAIKYSPNKSPIGLDVLADRSKQTVRIEVWDEGLGITPDDLKRLFHPFVQLDSSLSRQQTGTGLGLALVQRLVDMHGGSIKVESTFGEGSRFIVQLPYVTSDANGVEDEPASVQQSPNEEDDAIEADRLNRFLKLLGIHATIHNKEEGVVEKAAALQPDVILLDLKLPHVSGWVVLEQLKQNELTRHIPVVITSVQKEHERAKQLGAAGCLVKLFTMSDLRLTLSNIHEQDTSHTNTALLVTPKVHFGSIMIVDDNEINVQMLEDYLQSMNYAVSSAQSGIDFLARAVDVQPDLVLMDIQMPDMDGLETIRHLRLIPDRGLASVPVIAITALAMPGDRERCLEAGANEYISKPIRLKELVSLIQRILTDTRSSDE